MYKFIGKKNQVYVIKLNYNCPDSEKSGSGPGSCGGGSKNSEKQTNDKTVNSVDTALDKITSEITNMDSEYKKVLKSGDRKTAAKLESDRNALMETHGKMIEERQIIKDKEKSVGEKLLVRNDKTFIPKNKTIEKNKEIVKNVKNIKIDNISSNYQSKQEDKEYIDETKKDITNSLSISKYNYTPDGMMEVIKSIDDNIAQLEMIISANIKYYNDKLDTNDKSVGMKIFHDKVTLAAMKEVNMANKEYYDKKIK